jgi:hypothetical protein
MSILRMFTPPPCTLHAAAVGLKRVYLSAGDARAYTLGWLTWPGNISCPEDTPAGQGWADRQRRHERDTVSAGQTAAADDIMDWAVNARVAT